MRKQLLAAVAMSALSACSVLSTPVQRGYDIGRPSASWRYVVHASTGNLNVKNKERSTFTTADVRIITQRMHPVLGNEVDCAEPGPDVAKALSTAASLQASGGNGVAQGGLGLSGSSAEAAVELAGRSTALLALRDGLFRACEAYGNGVIGEDMYGLIIARYSSLMSTLFLAQDMTGVVGAEGRAAATSNALQVLGAPAPPTSTTKPADSSSGSGTNTSTGSGSGSSSTASWSASGDAFLSADLRGDERPRPPRLSLASYLPGDDQDAMATPTLLRRISDAATAPAGDAAPKSGAASSAPSTTPNDSQSTTTTAGSVASLALARMNEDYMGQGIVDILMTSCINQNDPTRLAPRDSTGAERANGFLYTACKDVTTAQSMQIQTADGNFETVMRSPIDEWMLALPHVRVNPEAGVGVASSASLDAGTKVKAPADPAVAVLKQVQTALGAMSSCSACDPKRADGVLDWNTVSAVKAYQIKYVPRYSGKRSAKATGDPFDPETLSSLHIKPASAPKAPDA